MSNFGVISIVALIAYIYRLQALNFRGYMKFYDYDRDLARKYELYLFTENNKYRTFHFIGIALSVVAIVSSFVKSMILTIIFCICFFVYFLLYSIKFEDKITAASKNENRCVFLLSRMVELSEKEDYEWGTKSNESDEIRNLYHCCKHDKMTMLFDILPLIVLGLAVLTSFFNRT